VVYGSGTQLPKEPGTLGGLKVIKREINQAIALALGRKVGK